MFLDRFHSDAGGAVRITPEQASRFAKEVAGDFNPLHDPDAKRFCVPGDLLFSLVLAKYGVSQRMSFVFKGMVGGGVSLQFPSTEDGLIPIADGAGKVYLEVERDGALAREPELVESLARAYVAFSGRNFPHILVPLMAERDVMINPERPLVIYESMSFELDRLDVGEIGLELTEATLEVDGKRGDTGLYFSILADGEAIGRGSKKLVMSGLRAYDEAAMQRVVDEYVSRKTNYSLAS